MQGPKPNTPNVPYRIALVAISGLVLIILGQILEDFRLLGFDYPKFFNDLGTFIIGLLVVQAVLDERSRRRLVFSAVREAVSGYKAVHSGILDVRSDSRTAAGEFVFDEGGGVTICFNHNAALFDRIEPKLAERASKGFPTSVVLMAPNGKAMKNEMPVKADRDHAAADVRKICERIRKINSHDPGAIQLYHYDRALSYIGMCSDEHAWMMPYTNSTGRATVPAICMKAGNSGLHAFIKADLERVVSASTRVAL